MSDIFKNLPNDVKAVVIDKLCDNSDNHNRCMIQFKGIMVKVFKGLMADKFGDLLYIGYPSKVRCLRVFNAPPPEHLCAEEKIAWVRKHRTMR